MSEQQTANLTQQKMKNRATKDKIEDVQEKKRGTRGSVVFDNEEKTELMKFLNPNKVLFTHV